MLSIFATREEAKQFARYHRLPGVPRRPLADNTLRRTARGIQRYVLNNPKPYIIRTAHADDSGKVQSVTDPISTICTKNEHCLLAPMIVPVRHEGDRRVHPLTEPVPTITTSHRGELALASPVLVELAHGEHDNRGRRPVNLDYPLGTQHAGGNKYALCAAFLEKHYGDNGQAPGSQLDKSIDTITAIDHHSLVTASLQRDFGNSVGNDISAPAGAITADGGGKLALLTSHLLKMRGTSEAHLNQSAQDLHTPVPTSTAGGQHFAEVRALLVKYYGTGTSKRVDEPLDTVTTQDRFGLVTVAGEDYLIADIGLRMLEPKELFLAQGFPPSYKIRVPYNGKLLCKEEQVKLVGNSVSPPIACALVLANVGAKQALGPDSKEWAPGRVKSGEQMAFLDLQEIA